MDDSGGQGPLCPLDNNHSHFILVEPGPPGKGDGPTELRLRLERHISEQRTGYGGEARLPGCPGRPPGNMGRWGWGGTVRGQGWKDHQGGGEGHSGLKAPRWPRRGSRQPACWGMQLWGVALPGDNIPNRWQSGFRLMPSGAPLATGSGSGLGALGRN